MHFFTAILTILYIAIEIMQYLEFLQIGMQKKIKRTPVRLTSVVGVDGFEPPTLCL